MGKRWAEVSGTRSAPYLDGPNRAERDNDAAGVRCTYPLRFGQRCALEYGHDGPHQYRRWLPQRYLDGPNRNAIPHRAEGRDCPLVDDE
ncbi:MAG: hypothetical protein WAU89_23435 [Candidatus Acidiferrales bacterium]